MSNEVINPFQQFQQFAGQVNANGQIEFFETSARITPKDIFEDDALSIAQTNPYTLDDIGRIRGDVKYEGTATLVHTDVDNFEFRQDDLVVVSNDGDTGSITIQKESVAAMRADQGLVLGNIVRTRGYNAPTHFGGARYVIVAGATGTADDYRFINLGNGLQAQLLDLQANKNFLAAGARGDGGSDDTEPMQAVITFGGDIAVPGGFTFVATNLRIPLNVRFIGQGAMKQRAGASGDLFQITSVDVTLVKFRDVILDGNQPNVNENNSTVGWIIPAVT